MDDLPAMGPDAAAGAAGGGASTCDSLGPYFDGAVLVSPRPADRSGLVVLVCAHDETGAMGMRLNRTSESLAFADVLLQAAASTPGEVDAFRERRRFVRVLEAGPRESDRGFVLHSLDFRGETTVDVSGEIGLTATLDILKAIADGEGPARAVFGKGCETWDAGELEAEIGRNKWLVCPFFPDLVFGADDAAKRAMALARMGVDPRILWPTAGNA